MKEYKTFEEYKKSYYPNRFDEELHSNSRRKVFSETLSGSRLTKDAREGIVSEIRRFHTQN